MVGDRCVVPAVRSYGSSVMGEVPFVEVVPQLFVLDEKDLARALQLPQLDLPREPEGQDGSAPSAG